MRLFDLHADTLTVCERGGDSLFQNNYHVDVHRALSLYDQWHQVFSVYVSDDLDEQEAWVYTCRCMDYYRQQVAYLQKQYPDTRTFLLIPAIENGKSIGSDRHHIAVLAGLGVWYMTLTWNGSNRLGNGCLSTCSDGLTAFGKEVVRDLFLYGIVPDVSHLNDAGFWDVVSIADGRRIMASHSVSRAVCDHPRNLTDAQFDAIVASNGLVGLNVCAAQLGEQRFDRLERHLVHFLERNGDTVLALGFDLDGTSIPKEWCGIETAYRFYEYLLRKNYSDSLLESIFFENSQAFFTKTLTSKKECIRIGT